MGKNMFIVDCGIFPFDVMVCLGVSKRKMIEQLKDNTTKSEQKEIKEYFIKKGLYMMFKNNTSLIYVPNFKKNAFYFGLLQHEIMHCVVTVLSKTDIKLSLKTEEVFAYLTQYLTQKIYEKMEITFS
jgi:hypothetical protein